MNLAIGQGDVQVTPLQLARACRHSRTVARVTPHIGGRVVGLHGETIERIKPEPSGALRISEEHPEHDPGGTQPGGDGARRDLLLGLRRSRSRSPGRPEPRSGGRAPQTGPGIPRSPRTASRDRGGRNRRAGRASASSRRRRSSPRSSSGTSTPTGGQTAYRRDRGYEGWSDGGRSETTDDRAAGPAPCRAAPPLLLDRDPARHLNRAAALQRLRARDGDQRGDRRQPGYFAIRPGPLRGRRGGADGRPCSSTTRGCGTCG